MSTLNDFISSVKTTGLIHTNRFSVEFNLPPIISKYGFAGDLKKVLMMCDTVNLPGLSISTQQSRTYGEYREMPYERLYENINLTFLIDNSMDGKALFDTWINSIQDPATRQFNYYKEYTTDLTVLVQDKSDKPTYRVKLFECYPKSVSAIQMDYSAKEVMKLQVSMNYRYWLSSSVVADPNNGAIVDGRENLKKDGSQPGLDPFGDDQQRPNFNVENENFAPKF